jgi:hypothetical protein
MLKSGRIDMGIYQITVQGEVPQLFLGAEVGGAKVVAIKDVSPKLVGSKYLAEIYNISEETVRSRCAHINRGTRGKSQYNPDEAHLVLSEKPSKRVGRPRKN